MLYSRLLIWGWTDVTVLARLAGRNMDLCGGSHCLSEFDEKGLRASVSCGKSTGGRTEDGELTQVILVVGE